MAHWYREEREVDERSRRRRHHHTHSALGGNDWNLDGNSGRYLVPDRNGRELRDIERYPDDQGRQTTSFSHPRRSHTSSRSRSNVMMPAQERPGRSYTTGHYERGRGPYVYDSQLDHDLASGTDSRRSSRRAHTPGSAHYYVSTPVSKISSRTSLSESDGESARSQSPSAHTREYDLDDHYGRGSLEDHRVTSEGRRRRRRKYRRDTIYEDELCEEPEEYRVGSPETEPIRAHEHEPELEPEPSTEERDTIREAHSVHEEELAHRIVDFEEQEEEDDDDDDDEEEEDDDDDEEEEQEAVPSHSRSRHPPSHRRQERSRESYTLVAGPPPSAPRPPKRPSTKTHSSDVVRVQRASPRRSHTIGGGGGSHSHRTQQSSVAPPARRSSFVEKLIFRPGRAPEKTTKQQVQCVICFGSFSSTKTAGLKCGHHMCSSCLKRSFELSVNDPQHMPPTCCTSDHIPLKHVSGLFNDKFKRHWNRKFAEYSTRNRLYCPSRRCGEWIKPENIRKDENGRKSAKCSKCKTKVCGSCNGKWHSSRSCPNDEATNQILRQAKEEGWQRCYNCRSLVELKEGCNHMTCRCGAQFCMICGDKWKTCDCPWFNYEGPDNANHPEIEMHSHSDIHPHLALRTGRYPSPSSLRDYHLAAPPPNEPMMRPRPPSLEDEKRLRELRDIREQDLSRRFESLEVDDDEEDSDFIERSTSSGEKRTHDEYRRGRGIIPPPPPTGPSPFDRVTRPTFVPEVAQAPSGAGSSIDKCQQDRLADRFSSHRTTYSSPSVVLPPHMMLPMGGPVSPVAPLAPNPYRTVMTGPPPIMRRHTGVGDYYSAMMSAPPSERVVPGRIRHDYAAEAAVHAPLSRRSTGGAAKASSMAGLSGAGSGMDRVYEWRHHVAPGKPEEQERRNKR